jgi:hypothetical protein
MCCVETEIIILLATHLCICPKPGFPYVVVFHVFKLVFIISKGNQQVYKKQLNNCILSHKDKFNCMFNKGGISSSEKSTSKIIHYKHIQV